MPKQRPSHKGAIRAVVAFSVLLLVIGATITANRSADSADERVLGAPGSSAPPDGLGRSLRPMSPGTVPTTARPATAAPAVTLPGVRGEVTWPSGTFSGGELADHKAFGAWRGRKVDTALYFTAQDSWAAMENPSFWTNQHSLDRSVTPILSYAMWPAEEKGASLAKGAAGEYDEHWVTLARNLVAQGLPNAIIRPGWEFNGTWYEWKAVGDQGARDYAAYFRNIAEAMKSVPGQRFRFSWCPVEANGGIDVEKAYPGDDVVDDIGLDVYNSYFRTVGSPAQQWQQHLDNKYGLKWQLAFAKEHGKKHSFPEWAGYAAPDNPSTGGGDDALFVRNMFAWMVEHPPAFENYFNYDTTYGVYYGIQTRTSVLPRSSEIYRKYWRA